MLHRQFDFRSLPPNQRLRQWARNQPPHSTATKAEKRIKKNIFHFKKFKHDFLLIMIFKCLILFQINNHHHACIKKNLRRASKWSEFFAKRGFSFETPNTETCDNQKELFDHSQFSFDSRADGYRPQRVGKKNRPSDNIFEFRSRHKIFSYKRIESLVIEKSEYDA